MTHEAARVEGTRARTFVLASMAIIAVTYGLARYAYGLFVPDLRLEFRLSTAEIGFIASGSYVAYLAAIPVSSVLAARTGPRRLVALGGAAAVAGMGLVALAPDAITLAVGVFVAGAGSGLVWPPLSEALARLVSEERRERAFGLVNSGTSYGVALAGPIALVAGGQWRAGWFSFAVLGVVATVWLARLLPSGRLDQRERLPRLRASWVFTRQTSFLLAFALCFGTATSAYWAFSVDLVAHSHGGATTGGRVFLTIVGMAGIIGGVAGDLTGRFGLRAVLVGTSAAVLASMALLPAASSSWAAVAASALVFGAAFIGVAAALALWTVRAYVDRPAAGMGAMSTLFTIGSILGPALFGIVAAASELEFALWCAAVTTAVMLTLASKAPA